MHHNDIEERLYDTYNEQSVIESNPMLQKKMDALSPLKLQVKSLNNVHQVIK